METSGQDRRAGEITGMRQSQSRDAHGWQQDVHGQQRQSSPGLLCNFWERGKGSRPSILSKEALRIQCEGSASAVPCFLVNRGLFSPEREPVISTCTENRAQEHIFHLVSGGTEAGLKEELEILRQQRSWDPFPRWQSRGMAQGWLRRGAIPERDTVEREGSELGLLSLSL